MRPTLSDVALAAGVSVASASLVLSNRHKGRVSEEKTRDILKAAKDLQYVRNGVASSLRTKRSQTIGLITDYVSTTPYAFQIVAEASRIAREHHHTLILTDTAGDTDTQERAVRELHAQNVDLIALVPMFHQCISLPAGASDSLVIIDGFEASHTTPSIVPDEFRGEYLAVQHLIECGHTRIAHISGDGTTIAGQMRIDGYRAALKDAGISVPEHYLEYSSFKLSTIDQAAARLLSLEQRPTAITTFNDGVAAGVIHEAHRRGLRIPQDLSIVGFDNFEVIATYTNPQLTTIQLPHKEMARWGVHRLLGINDPELEQQTSPSHNTDGARTWPLKAPCPLVLRDSTAPPPQTM